MQYSITEFEEIYRRCFRSALKLAFSLLHDDDEARDAVQEVFLKLWESDSVVENEGAYILRMVRNNCLNRIAATDSHERIKRRLPFEEVEETEELSLDGDKLTHAVTTLLTPREKEVVEKIYSENLSYKDAAGQLGVSVAMINKCVVNALKKLRNHFKSV